MSSSVSPEDRQPRRIRDEMNSSDPRDGRGDRNDDGHLDYSDSRRDYDANGSHAKDPRDYDTAGSHEADSRGYDDDTRVFAVPPGAHDTLSSDPKAARETVVAREKEQFGGIKVGSAFFGWLTATGMAVLLTALVAAAGTTVGLATNTDVGEAASQAGGQESLGIIGIVVLLAILFVAYYCGGYVAGRMARFNGAKQGLMVWLWAIIFAVIVAVLGAIAGERFNILANLNSFPRIPVNEGQLSTMGIIAAVVVAGVSLIGAVLGGLAGMRFHRKVDRAGFTPSDSHSDR
jgi:hypothetical protein